MADLGGKEASELSLRHELDVDERTGSAALRVPIPATSGRDGFGPQLSLDYRSGAVNSPFGAGWSLSGLPAISIATREHLPRWDGTDGYELGGEDLVPWLQRAGDNWVPRGFERDGYRVTFLRPRRGGAIVRVERWLRLATGDVHFRMRDARNVITVLGARPLSSARIADPSDPSRIFQWLPELQVDQRGNAIWFEHVAENADGVDGGAPFERRRTPTAQRYLKRIRYGNTLQIALTPSVLEGTRPDGRWCFQLVFDYGDHGTDAVPTVEPTPGWPARRDPFSAFRGGFEARTHRLCRRVLMLHEFPALGPGPVLVGHLALDHDEHEAGSTLKTIRWIGSRVDDGVTRRRALPPLTMQYAPPLTGTAFDEPPRRTKENAPEGLVGRRSRMVDLFGEGLPGILAEDDRAWYYKPNRGGGSFDPQTTVLERPAVRPSTFALGDFDQDGDTEAAQRAGRLAGRFSMSRASETWSGYVPFEALPHLEALGARAEWVDLNGDGRPDVVIARADALVWFPSDGERFSPPVEIARPPGAEAIPSLAAESTGDLFFADMTGSGMPALVRIRDGLVEYWPSLGNGRFAERVVVEDPPIFDRRAPFDRSRLHLVDLDGSGTTDLVYVGEGEVSCWINASGNRFLPGPRVAGLPYLGALAALDVVDFLADGSACLVWSSPLPGRDSAVEYLSLVPADRPRLLTSVDDGRGKATIITYGNSAEHYLRDVASGRGWVSRLPHHATVVDRIETRDAIGGTSVVRRFAYHDGRYDGREREPRGFGQVDVYDSPAAEGGAPGTDGLAFAAPALTRSWFHPGMSTDGEDWFVDAYRGDAMLPRLAAHEVVDDLALSADALDEALRAVAGRMIRQEVFSVDDRDRRSPHPFEVQQHSFTLRSTQPGRLGKRPAFRVDPSESATWTYEQVAGDPRVAHSMVVDTDAYGVARRSAVVAYPRRTPAPRIDTQARHLISVTDHQPIHVDTDALFAIDLPATDQNLELAGIRPGPSGLFRASDLGSAPVAAALTSPQAHHAPLADDPASGPRARLLSRSEAFYWNDESNAPLPLGEVGALLLPHHSEQACFDPTFVTAAYDGLVDQARLLELGYLLRDGLFWRANPVQRFGPASWFFKLEAMERADGATARFTYDDDLLAVADEVDPLKGTTSFALDYHLVAPFRVTDPNGNVSEVRFDPLGVAAVATTWGHVGSEPWGFDAFADIPVDDPPSIEAVLADPGRYLHGAARAVFYDLDAWAAEGAPTRQLTLAREALIADGVGGGARDGRIAIALAYLDGFGRPLQEKQLVEPGPAIQIDATDKVVVDANGEPVLAFSSTRWRSTGHVEQDAKQRPGRTHKPYFSPRVAYESLAMVRNIGPATIHRYDAIGRPVGDVNPDGTYSATTFTAWTVETADVNDTILTSPLGAVLAALPAGDAARLPFDHATAHAGTTTTTHLDTLGRPVLVHERGGAGADDRRIETVLDAGGEPTRVIDPRGLEAFVYRADMLGRRGYERSLDAGVTITVHDPYDRVARARGGRGVTLDYSYDLLDRPTALDARREATANSVAIDHRVQTMVYGEALPDPEDAKRRNLLGTAAIIRDGVGELTLEACTPTGLPMTAVRRLRDPAGTEVDWRVPVPLESETFTTTTVYDALDRPLRDTLPSGITRSFEYLPSGAAGAVRVTSADGSLIAHPVVTDTSVGAGGEVLGMRLGGAVDLGFRYDRNADRLIAQTAVRGSKRLQDIGYLHDPVGNIIRIVDEAHQGPDPLIKGMSSPSKRDYIYDAHYRLKQATGRVHKALLPTDAFRTSTDTFPGSRRVSLADGSAVEGFTRTYSYDPSGNLLEMKHQGSQTWTNAMWVSSSSNRSLPAVDLNGLPTANPEKHFDDAGNLAIAAHLRRLDWNAQGSLAGAVTTERASGVDDAERYLYDAEGLRARKITTVLGTNGVVETTEKIYFGDAERTRFMLDNRVVFERWTTHVTNGRERVALVYSWKRDDLGRDVDADLVGKSRIHYQLNTHQGSAAIELDQNGQVISYEEYFPYGATAFVAGADTREVRRKEYRYCGKERDGLTGFYDYGQRYYACWLGRWISPDPIGPEDDLNLYQFVLGDPVGNVDENGLETLDPMGLVGMTIVYVNGDARVFLAPGGVMTVIRTAERSRGMATEVVGGERTASDGIREVGGVNLSRGSQKPHESTPAPTPPSSQRPSKLREFVVEVDGKRVAEGYEEVETTPEGTYEPPPGGTAPGTGLSGEARQLENSLEHNTGAVLDIAAEHLSPLAEDLKASVGQAADWVRANGPQTRQNGEIADAIDTVGDLVIDTAGEIGRDAVVGIAKIPRTIHDAPETLGALPGKLSTNLESLREARTDEEILKALIDTGKTLGDAENTLRALAIPLNVAGAFTRRLSPGRIAAATVAQPKAGSTKPLPNSPGPVGSHTHSTSLPQAGPPTAGATTPPVSFAAPKRSNAGGGAGAKAALTGVSRTWPKHHAFPMYLGGAADQTLKKIPRNLHYRFHAALDQWKGGKYARSHGAAHFQGMSKDEVIKDVREFYRKAEGGIFRKYLPDFEQAVMESI